MNDESNGAQHGSVIVPPAPSTIDLSDWVVLGTGVRRFVGRPVTSGDWDGEVLAPAYELMVQHLQDRAGNVGITKSLLPIDGFEMGSFTVARPETRYLVRDLSESDRAQIAHMVGRLQTANRLRTEGKPRIVVPGRS